MSLYWEQVLFKLTCLPSWTHLVLINFCCAFRLCHPFKSFALSPSLLFQKDWNFNFSISPSNEYSGLISFRIDWFDLLAAQGTLQSLLQHRKYQFFSAQPASWSNSHIHTWLLEKPLTRWPFVTKCFLILYVCHSSKMHPSVNFMTVVLSTMILEPKKIKSVSVLLFPHLFVMKWWDLMPWS